MRKRKHSYGYVTRIIAYESNMTERDVIRIYHERYGVNRTFSEIIEEFRYCNVDTIRWMLSIGKYAK